MVKNTKKKLPYPKTRRIAIWSDDTENIRDIINVLKSFGIKAKSTHSVYVGHKLLSIPCYQRKEAAKIIRREIKDKYIADLYSDRYADFKCLFGFNPMELTKVQRFKLPKRVP